MLRLKIDPSGRFGRWFRPLAALVVLILGVAFALVEARSSDREMFTVAALLAAAALGAFVLLLPRRR